MVFGVWCMSHSFQCRAGSESSGSGSLTQKEAPIRVGAKLLWSDQLQLGRGSETLAPNYQLSIIKWAKKSTLNVIKPKK